MKLPTEQALWHRNRRKMVSVGRIKAGSTGKYPGQTAVLPRRGVFALSPLCHQIKVEVCYPVLSL